jgi:acetyltransferase-like isoleucine patch superfamily enzyme
VAFSTFLARIRRRETPFYAFLFRVGRFGQHFEVPMVRPLHLALYHERMFRLTVWSNLLRILYYQPMFRARCVSVGRGLRLEEGVPIVLGDLRIRIGEGARISGTTTFVASPASREPVLEIGDSSYIGYQVSISVGARVSIGSHVLLANRVFLAGDDGHPLDPIERRSRPGSGTGSIVIEDDVWIGEAAIVLKDVRVGRGAVVAAGAVVTADVPPLTVVAGNPARVVKQIGQAPVVAPEVGERPAAEYTEPRVRP